MESVWIYSVIYIKDNILKKYARWILVLIVSLYTLTACTLMPHQPKAYVCVEKPPFKVTYIDYHEDISSETVSSMMDKALKVPYQNTLLNNSNSVSISYDAQAVLNSSSQTSIGVSR